MALPHVLVVKTTETSQVTSQAECLACGGHLDMMAAIGRHRGLHPGHCSTVEYHNVWFPSARKRYVYALL